MDTQTVEALTHAQRALEDANRVVSGMLLREQGVGEFIHYEPEHVLHVARGGAARWVRSSWDGSWVICCRADELRPDGTVVVVQRNGSASVERVGKVLFSGTVDGAFVGVVAKG